MVLMSDFKDAVLGLPTLPTTDIPQVNLNSTVKELTLYDFQVEASHLGKEVAAQLDTYPLLPGVIIVEDEQFLGMISRRRFLERMSRPYGLDLFLKRPLKALYDFTNTEIVILSADTLIVDAAQRSLRRRSELLYEPLVVEIEPRVYRLLDVHQILVAQSEIHRLTTKLLEEQTHAHMVQTEKMASLGRMVAGVAHEIRNPVNCINGNLGFLTNYSQDVIELLDKYQEEIGDKPAQLVEYEEDIELEFLLEDFPKMLQSMDVAAKRLTEIVTSLRNFSRIEDRKKQLVDVHECLESTLLILNNRLKHGIKVEKNYGEITPIIGFSGQLGQVFMNILANGIDAVVERQEKDQSKPKDWEPTISVTTQIQEVEDKSTWVAIHLQDNGIGIPPELQEKIFDAFFTTKPVGKGTGLGLSISNQIISQKHGGVLKMRSQLNLGTEFEILLPVQNLDNFEQNEQ